MFVVWCYIINVIPFDHETSYLCKAPDEKVKKNLFFAFYQHRFCTHWSKCHEISEIIELIWSRRERSLLPIVYSVQNAFDACKHHNKNHVTPYMIHKLLFVASIKNATFYIGFVIASHTPFNIYILTRNPNIMVKICPKLFIVN
jgi:hypothetical protein